MACKTTVLDTDLTINSIRIVALLKIMKGLQFKVEAAILRKEGSLIITF